MPDALMSLDAFTTLVDGLDHPECVTVKPVYQRGALWPSQARVVVGEAEDPPFVHVL